MFSCAGRIASPHILPWSCPSGEGGLPIRPSFLVPAGFLSRTYSHGRACPARAIGAVPLFRECVFLSSYKTVFAVSSKPVMPVRQKGSPVSVHVFLCRKHCLPAHTPMVAPARRGPSERFPFFGNASFFPHTKQYSPFHLNQSCPSGEDCVHYTIFLIAAAPSKAETLGRRFSPRAAAKNPLHRSL